MTPSPRMPAAPAKIRLAIAARPALLCCDALSRLLRLEPDLEVVGQGLDEDHIGLMIKAEDPDVLIFDYDALGPNPEGIISRLRRAAPRTRILVIAKASEDENVERVLRVGAAGMVGKQLDFESLLHAIHTVAAGEIWANRRVQAMALERLTNGGGSQPDSRLTRREREIADGVARGLRNKEIARQLNISDKTVKSHLNNIFHKLRLEGRFALAMLDQSQIQPSNLVPFSPRTRHELERVAETLP